MLSRFIAFALALSYLANGAYMVLAPAAWYARVPGVTATGPMNTHFIVDIGFAYLLCAGAFIVASVRPRELARWALLGSAWPALHGAFHLSEWLHHSAPAGLILLVEAGAVLLPPALGLTLAIASRRHLAA